MKWLVRAWDENFVEKKIFNDEKKALKYADWMCEIFGSWNVEIYKI